MATLRPPADLGAAGLTLWKRLTSVPKGETLVFSASEQVVLELAVRQADDVARLEDLLSEQGATVLGSKGQVRLSSALVELRLQRAALARLVSMLALPDETEAEGVQPAQRRAQAAAQARWRKQARLAKAKHGGDG